MLIQEMLKLPPTLEDLIEIREQVCNLPARQFAEFLASNEYKAWLREHGELIKHLRRAEAASNLARRARRDAMLLESVKPFLQEIRA